MRKPQMREGKSNQIADRAAAYIYDGELFFRQLLDALIVVHFDSQRFVRTRAALAEPMMRFEVYAANLRVAKRK